MYIRGFIPSHTVIPKSTLLLFIGGIWPRIFRLDSVSVRFLMLGPKTEDLFTDILGCQVFSQSTSASRVCCSRFTSLLFSTRRLSLRSSENNLTVTPNCCNASVKSSVNITKSIGPSALTLLVGRQEGHPACKKQWGMVEVGTGWSGWSGAQPHGRCLPLLVFPCTRKSRSFLLAPAHPGGPGKRAVNGGCCVAV